MAESNDIEGFYRLHSDSVYSYLVSLCRDRSRAEDLMQDTFVKATRALGGYRGGSPKAWLFSVARTVYLDDLRRRARRPVLVEEQDFAAAPVSDPVEQDAIERALGRLPERQQTALVLSDRVGLAGSEVAAALGISEGAARVLVHRARQTFRVAYDEETG
ncbi:MAG TPA: RNA polymerase sigma factor [Acidimicrobiia bacterium]|nr:RNA polymerase sigma factor [Acidimicrobiia bacterium]